MVQSKKEDDSIDMIVWRLILTLIGLVVAFIFIRDRKEIINSYRELKEESPFVALLVVWLFSILMLITFSTIGTIVWIIIKLAKS